MYLVLIRLSYSVLSVLHGTCSIDNSLQEKYPLDPCMITFTCKYLTVGKKPNSQISDC